MSLDTSRFCFAKGFGFVEKDEDLTFLDIFFVLFFGELKLFYTFA